MADLYIPSEGLFFRLLGYKSNCCIYSRNKNEPRVGHYSMANGIFADQWFSVITGTGSHAGLHAIKGRESGYVLYSRAKNDPKVNHVAGDGQYDDNWFRFEPGTGTFSGYFRLLTPSANMVLYSRAENDPKFGNYRATSTFPDHYFSFIFEDMTVTKVAYDFDQARLASSQPLVIASQTIDNNTDVSQQTTVDISVTETHTSTFEHTWGFTITVGTTFSAGIPFVTGGEVSLSVSTEKTFTWGSSNEISRLWSGTFIATAPPHKTVKAVSTVTKGTITVPYTITLASKSGATATAKGIWNGVSTWDLRNTVNEV
ncbi:hemolytic lectin [Mycena belliarum]|uniref:Hemolytic lectin n=1 Tax=Mycena belliarum TaxID=1033014 RepID=A0AAD6UBX9_9AGAR|nr:hemolytic lectin [Mycena belliae]